MYFNKKKVHKEKMQYLRNLCYLLWSVIQRNNYYPFGMFFGEELGEEHGKQNFKYNGKELDKEHGLNQYDYAARFMDPSMIRFTTNCRSSC